MKLRAIFLIATLASLLGVRAQKLTVEAMKPAPMDLSASQYERKDLTGKACALVKVQLATAGAKFQGNVIGNTSYDTGEYWVYMSEGSYMLSVKHPNFVPLDLDFRDYGINGVQTKNTYKLTLLMPQVGSGNADDGMNYLVMTVEPANASVSIDGQAQMVQNGMLSILLPMGEHRYEVSSPAYESKIGTFTISGEKLTLPVRLASAMATLTVSCATSGTQIYVNDELKGTSSWSGTLPAGSYRVEGRLAGYRSHRQSVTLARLGRQQVTIPALQSVSGSLNVNYQPTNAEVWIDGRKVGSSPDIFRNLNVGSHEVELRASGYHTKKETVTIQDGQTAMLSGSLESQSVVQTPTVAQPVTPPTTNSTSENAIETFTVNGVSFNMIRVDGGTFMMGATSEQGSDVYDNEKPVHQVTLFSYSIGETEVTQALWQAVMGSNPSKYKGANRPVETVSWNDCQKFIRKLNDMTGKKFRLPTEAEWEYVARGGKKSQGYKYSGSNNLSEVAWHLNNSGNTPHDVKTKQANELGLYDMSGNVWEWCQDRYGNYGSSSQANPSGPSYGSYRVFRGGGWGSPAWYCRVSFRFNNSPDHSSYSLGLRLAL